MKNIIIPLFCLILFNCSKSNNQNEVKADLVEIMDEDKASASMDMMAPPPPPKEEEPINAISEKAVNTTPNVSATQNNSISKKIIKNGDMEI